MSREVYGIRKFYDDDVRDLTQMNRRFAFVGGGCKLRVGFSSFETAFSNS